MSSRLASFFGIGEFTPKALRVVYSYVSLSMLSNFTILTSSTFYILYILDLIDFVQAGILISLGFVLQAIIDYPTGVLADWLGYKWVLFISYVGHFVSFLALALLPVVQPPSLFTYLLVVYSIEAFSLAQESGALQSWFDNSYKLETQELDANKEHYKEIYGKSLMLIRLVGSVAIYAGGFVSDILGRETVFLIQAVFSIVLAIVFIRTITTFEKEPTQLSVKEYNKRLVAGIGLIFRSYGLFFFTLTFVLIYTVNRVWTGLIVFPIYYGYTGSDGLASTLRGTLFLLGSVLTGLSTRVSKKMNERKFLWRVFFLHAVLVYGSYGLILRIFPISTLQTAAEFDLLPIILVFLVASYANFSSGILLTLSQRIMMDVIPDQNRNSFYSLMPTLTLLVSSVVIALAGNFISTSQDFSLTVLLFIFIPVVLCSICSYFAMRFFYQSDDVKG